MSSFGNIQASLILRSFLTKLQLFCIPKTFGIGFERWLPEVSGQAVWSCKCAAMWVGFLSFFAGGRKKQNKFPSNLHCPVKKLNPFYFQFITIVYVSRLSFYYCCQRARYMQRVWFSRHFPITRKKR